MRTTRFAMSALAAAALVAATLTTASPAAAGSPPVPFPTSPKGLEAPVALPAALDPPSAYVPQVACQPGTPAGVAKLRELVLSTYGAGGRGNTARGCSEGTSEHADGRAWDWMVDVGDPREKAAAASFLAWLTKDRGANARRLGIMYVIYNEKIWAVYRADEGWRASSGHTDHVHVSFSWNGARGTTSFWTGKVHPVDVGPCTVFAGQPANITYAARTTRCYSAVAAPKRSRYATVRLGSRASSLAVAQKALGVPRSGVFDERTRTAVRGYQAAHDLPRTGALDTTTWASLVPGSVSSSTAAGMTVPAAARHGRDTYGAMTLRRWSAGTPVLVLQTALGMPVRDRNGYLDTVTVAAIEARQQQLGRAVTGTWTGADWEALAR